MNDYNEINDEDIIESQDSIPPKLQKALELSDLGRTREAASYLEDLLLQSPEDDLVRATLVDIYLESESYADAFFQAARRLMLNPTNTDVLQQLGVMLAGRGVEIAASFFDAAKSLEGPTLENSLLRGIVARKLGDSARACTIFEELVVEAPNDIDVLRELAESLIAEKSFAKAKPLLERLTKESPGDSEIWCWLGLSHRYCGNNERACNAFKTCLDLSPEHLQARYHYAACLLQDGKEATCKSILLETQVLAPKHVRTWINYDPAFDSIDSDFLRTSLMKSIAPREARS